MQEEGKVSLGLGSQFPKRRETRVIQESRACRPLGRVWWVLRRTPSKLVGSESASLHPVYRHCVEIDFQQEHRVESCSSELGIGRGIELLTKSRRLSAVYESISWH